MVIMCILRGAKAERVGGVGNCTRLVSMVWLLVTMGCCLFGPSMALPRTLTARPLQVITSEGKVNGKEDNGVHIFKSVPFASPPIGNLRFAPPIAPGQYANGEYDASNLDNTKSCMQFEQEPTSDEDCLYLDIYTPSEDDNSATLLPVYVFIHGGAFITGSKDLYSGLASFARKANIVAVAINYRLGAFGWLRVNSETPGNYGFLDQVQALKWINSNIAKFGGNPNLVTIGGQSAGANSVMLHLISPLSTGLFHKAFIESSMAQSYYPTKADADATSLQFSGYFNCVDDLKTCLESVSSVDIINKQIFEHLGPCIEGANPYYGYNIDKAYWYCGLAPEVGNSVLPGQMLNQLDPGVNPAVKSVPILIGTAWNEGLSDSSATYNPMRKMAPDAYENNQIDKTEGTYIHFLNQVTDLKSYDDNATSYSKLFSKRAQSVYQMYPYDSSDGGFINMYPQQYNGYGGPNTPLDANYVYNALYHDKWYLCPTMTAMSIVSKGSKARKKSPVYMYRFAQQTILNGYLYEEVYNSDPVVAVQNDFYSKNLYPSHGDDISFFNFKEDELFSEDEMKLGLRMFSALVDFIYTGNPNVGPFNKTLGVAWNKYYPYDRNMVLLAEPQISGLPLQLKGVRARQCEFWEKQGFVFPNKIEPTKKPTSPPTRKPGAV